MCTWAPSRRDADRDAALKHKRMPKIWVWALFRSWLSRKMDDGDDLEDKLGPPEKIVQLPGRQTRSAFVRTDSDFCLFCQGKKRDHQDHRRFKDLLRRRLHSGHGGQCRREERREDSFGSSSSVFVPKMCYTLYPAARPTARHPLGRGWSRGTACPGSCGSKR